MSIRGPREPEFVAIRELHLRDRLPGWYAIAGEVTQVLLYDGDWPSYVTVGKTYIDSITVEVPAHLMRAFDFHSLYGAWMVCYGHAKIVEDRRSLLATWVDVAEWPDPDQVLD